MLYIHIGLHKTGSSTLQRFCATNVELLAANGVIYPDVGEDSFSHAYIRSGFGYEVKRQATDPQIESFRALVEARQDAKIFITSESIGTLDEAGVAALAAAVKPFHEVRILVYLREIVGWTLSLYNQRCKSATSTLDFDSSLEAFGLMGGIEHLELIRLWGRHFGLENLRIRTIDRASLAGGDLILDILDALGLPAALKDAATPGSEEARNTSVRWEAAEFLRCFYQTVADAMPGWSERELVAVQRTKGLRRINAVTAVDKPRFQKTFRVARIIRLCDAAAVAAGGPAAQYVTPRQHAALTGLYNRQMATLREIVPDTRVADCTVPEPPERPFLPAFETIPTEVRAAIAAATLRGAPEGKVSPPIARALAEVCARARA